MSELETSKALFDILASGASWRAAVHHSWQINRRSRDSSSKFLDGNFRTRDEAMAAAKKAIAEKTAGMIVYSSARPHAFYSIGSVAEKQIGDVMNQYFLDEDKP